MTHKVEEQNVKNKIMIFNFILVMVAKREDCHKKKAKVRLTHQCPYHTLLHANNYPAICH